MNKQEYGFSDLWVHRSHLCTYICLCTVDRWIHCSYCGAETICLRSGSGFQKVSASAPSIASKTYRTFFLLKNHIDFGKFMDLARINFIQIMFSWKLKN